jgi:hypothetical protein
MKELTSAFMKKHLRLFNKMVKAETYKDIAKMKAERVREVFKRDFREIVSGKDGKTFYSPRKYQLDLDTGDDFTSEFKKLSTDKPERKKKYKGVSPEPTKKQKEIEKERSRVFDLLEKYPSFKDPPSTRGLQSKHELYTFLIFDAKTIKSLKEVERLIERAGKKEPKKAEPKPKPVTKKPEPKKEKPPFMKLREDIQELKEKLKKSYEKNKNKLSKMTTKKYEDTIKKQLNSFLDDAEEIYDDYNFSISKTNKNDLEKYYFSVVPKKQPK